MYRNNFSRKLFKTKNKKRKTKIRKQKTKIMRGGGEREECIDYLKTLTEYSKIKLYTFSGMIKGLQDVYDNTPLSEKIDELIRKIDELIGANYTLNKMNDVVSECRNVLNLLLLLLLKIRQQPDKLDRNIDKNIITTIIHIYEIIFGLESII